ncbi:hypothetical protein MTsPCn5_10120 [Croceitalea sp. MTPC5]|uniref:hypothetical protein n=1 Tax=Croceitalea sp. MTPC5 TaxID=3056565 RepID=UPI002B3F15AC|nr:hypothetical protein MTsPCn5_10120 [Croceitalea sp. MTPC5]
MKLLKYASLMLLLLVYFASCSGDDPVEEEQKTEDTPVTLEGDYIGTWNSTTDLDITYTDFGISAKFTFANNEKTRLSGEFFATTSFRSCCQDNGNDGTMLVNLDGDTIESFSFNDQIVNCTGSFSGTGSITSKAPYTLQIDFTGNDCDGNHIGQMIFTRRSN